MCPPHTPLFLYPLTDYKCIGCKSMTAKVVRLTHNVERTRVVSDVDPVFFRKEDITRGTLLTNYGRRDPRSTWRVADIRTYTRTSKEYYQLVSTENVRHLSDIITLVRIPRDDAFISEREPTFGSLSYSAIWRLK